MKLSKLKEIYLYKNKIGNDGLIALSIALREINNSSLEAFGISCNEIGDEGAIELANTL